MQKMKQPSTDDRLAIHARPGGFPLMHQNWGKLLFMHWALDPEILRPLIPKQLAIDTFGDKAWLGVVPFTMWGIRASFLPPIPGTSAFHELNVRTYVHYEGVPGVWFFSLDAANRLAVWGARSFYYLPYFNARMSLEQQAESIEYSSTRMDDDDYVRFMAKDLALPETRDRPRAELKTVWEFGAELPRAEPGSLEFFLTERYCLYSYRRRRLYRSRIFHESWPLRAVTVSEYQSTMIESLGIATPPEPPLLHYAEEIAVDIWPLQRL